MYTIWALGPLGVQIFLFGEECNPGPGHYLLSTIHTTPERLQFSAFGLLVFSRLPPVITCLESRLDLLQYNVVLFIWY